MKCVYNQDILLLEKKQTNYCRDTIHLYISVRIYYVKRKLMHTMPTDLAFLAL